jgi:hypothetical protein
MADAVDAPIAPMEDCVGAPYRWYLPECYTNTEGEGRDAECYKNTEREGRDTPHGDVGAVSVRLHVHIFQHEIDGGYHVVVWLVVIE